MKRLALALLCCTTVAAANTDHRLTMQVRPYVPPTIRTLGAAAQYLIEPSGYHIAPVLADGRDAGTLLHARITPSRDLAPVAMTDALLRLVPAHVGIVIDSEARAVAFAVVRVGEPRVKVIAAAEPEPDAEADIEHVAADLMPAPVPEPEPVAELPPVALAPAEPTTPALESPIAEPVNATVETVDATPLPSVSVSPPTLRLVAGERLSDQLARAANGAGFQMVWRARNDVEIETSGEFEGDTFPDQLESALRALWNTKPFYFDEYSNHVLIVQDAAP